MNKINILYADKEQNNLNAFLAYFRRNSDVEVETCLTALELLNHLKKRISQIVIVDQMILETIGIDFFHIAKINFTIAVTASNNLEYLEGILQSGKIFKYHPKPYELDDLNKSIEEAAFQLKSGSFSH